MEITSVATRPEVGDRPSELNRLPTAPNFHDIDRDKVVVFISAYKNYENKVAAFEQASNARQGTFNRIPFRSFLPSKPLMDGIDDFSSAGPKECR